MYKTDRQYQSDLCRFMIFFQGRTFHKDDGSVINKINLFNSIYTLHRYSDDRPFDVHKDTMCQLLDKNAHPNIRTANRDYVNFNENEELVRAAESVMSKKAISIVRDKVKDNRPTVVDMIGIVKSAMLQAYLHHEELDGEIESVLSGSAVS